MGKSADLTVVQKTISDTLHKEGVGLGPLVPVKGTLNASACQYILDNFILPTLWEQFGDDPFLFQHDCTPVHKARTFIIKFADDSTVTGLISDNEETAYRAEVQHLVAWCADNNLLLNTSKTKELIVDFRREKGRTHDLIHINGMAVERVSSFKFLGTHISEDLSWTTNTSSLVTKAHQHLFYLNTLKKNHLSSTILVNFLPSVGLRAS
ncbi:hypothetical protein QTP86_007847 [Hemibagrus guttatus]|nr:hypothetical protein QTP86_007847 [Hemibagrus guttatus]